MVAFSSLDLQKRTGEIQAAVAREPVVITHHGKPRAVMLSVDEYIRLKERAGEPVPAADVAASFQEAVADVLTAKAVRAAREHGVGHLLIGGGVAANSRLRELAAQRCAAAGIVLRVPPPRLCTDNGAMVAALGAQLVRHGEPPSSLDFPADTALPITRVTT